MTMQKAIFCPHFVRKTCHSCPHLTIPYSEQRVKKQEILKACLGYSHLAHCQWQEPVASPLSHFRNKAKMVVSGAVERPILGMLPNIYDGHSAVDLCDCPLYPKDFFPIFTHLKDFIGRAGLVPYQVAKNKGELKYILLTQAEKSKKVMLRFVLRSEKKCALIERELPALLQKLPQIEVVSANIQPKHSAILEGEKEIFFTSRHFLAEVFNNIPLFIRPQGFFQTNPFVAKKLYATASQWVRGWWQETQAGNQRECHLWDLFCGSGGFGLHVATGLKAITNVHLTGIEISPTAIECAKQSAKLLGLANVSFTALDVENFPFGRQLSPQIVIVNPPRRGIGEKMARFLNQLQPQLILYSSCNPKSMAKDLAYLNGYHLKKIQLFDMFPHTEHMEVMGLLERKA